MIRQASAQLDRETSKRHKHGLDRASFEVLHQRYFDDLRQFILRRVRDERLAEDLAQEAFLRAYRARRSFDCHRPAWPWLAQIAHNLLINTLRDERRRNAQEWTDEAALSEFADDRTGGDPALSFLNAQRGETIEACLSILTVRQRRILELRCLHGQSYAEIEMAEGLSTDALKSLLKRARRAFRTAYSAKIRDEELPVLVWVAGRRWTKVRSTWSSVRERYNGFVLSSRTPLPVAQSIIEALSVTAVATVLLFGPASLTTESGTSADLDRHRLPVASGQRSLKSPAHQSARATPLLAHSVRTPDSSSTQADASLVAELDKNHPYRRTITINRRERRPGRPEEEGSETKIDIPCDYLGPDRLVCEAVDNLDAPKEPADSKP